MLDGMPGHRPERHVGVGRITAAKPAVRAAKQQVLKAVKEKCAPASHLSDNDFANKVLATDGNKNAVREATLAKERNNQKSYQARNRQNRLSGQIAVISASRPAFSSQTA